MEAIQITMEKEELRARLQDFAEPEYREFSKKLLPGVRDILGVRIPHLRKIARQAAKGAWRELLENIEDSRSMEETMVYGMILGYAKDIEWDEFLARIVHFLTEIDNWSVCDSVCCTLKKVKEDREGFWKFVTPYLSSEKEFEVRFAAVMVLNFYIDKEWVERTIDALVTLHPDGYYAKMGVAWALSICWISFPEETKKRVKREEMDQEIYEKMIQKVMESTRTTREEKEYLRARRKAEKDGKLQ